MPLTMPALSRLLVLVTTMVLLGLLAAMPRVVYAQASHQCTAAPPSILDFGNEVTAQGADMVISFDVSCHNTSGGQSRNYYICLSLDPGSNGSINPRRMTSAAGGELLYDLYADAAHTRMILGRNNQTYLSDVLIAVAPNGTASRQFNIYGRIHPGQAVPAGGPYTESGITGLLHYDWGDRASADCTHDSPVFTIGHVTAGYESSCTIDASDLDFDPTIGLQQTVDGVSTVRVQCAPETEWTLGLSDGLHPENGIRRMRGGGGKYVTYGLYLDPGRTRAWGDLNTDERYRGQTDYNGSPTFVTVYGRVPAQDEVPAGEYIDTVVATVYY